MLDAAQEAVQVLQKQQAGMLKQQPSFNTQLIQEELMGLKKLKRELMRQHLIPWEDDDDGTRLPGQWVNIRVFISSSFIDTQAERDMIVQKVLPKLNFELQKNFVRVTFVDLRWGYLLLCSSVSNFALHNVFICMIFI